MIHPYCMPKPASKLQPHNIFKWLCVGGLNYTPCVRLLWHIPFLTLLQKETCLHRQIFGQPSCWSGTRCAFLQYKCVQWWCLSFLAWHLKGVNRLEFILEGCKPAAATDGSNTGDAVGLWGCVGALTCCWWLREMPHTLRDREMSRLLKKYPNIKTMHQFASWAPEGLQDLLHRFQWEKYHPAGWWFAESSVACPHTQAEFQRQCRSKEKASDKATAQSTMRVNNLGTIRCKKSQMQALKESQGIASECIPRQETGTNAGQRAPAARLPLLAHQGRWQIILPLRRAWKRDTFRLVCLWE